MKNRITVMCLVGSVLVSTSVLGQSGNLVTNGSFEDGNQPECWAQGDFASGWESRYEHDDQQDVYLHSPDLYDDNVNFTAGSPCTGANGSGLGYPRVNNGATPAKTGRRYMGISTYELIQQELNQAPIPGEHYTFSMYIHPTTAFPSNWNGSQGRMKVGLAKQKVKYKSENDANDLCLEDYITYQDGISQNIDIIGTELCDLAQFPLANGWQRVSFSFIAPKPTIGWDYKWLFIDLEIPNYTPPTTAGASCNGDFMYIDDVGLFPAEMCGSACSPDLGTLIYGDTDASGTFIQWAVENDMLANHGESFAMLFQNAIGIDFTLFSSWGQEMYHQSAFDVNGLIDPGYPDYQFVWLGEDANGNTFPDDIYVYNLRAWNCNPGDEIQIIGQLLNYSVPSSADPTLFYPLQVDYDLVDCCIDHAYFANINFTGFFQEDVHDFITAGEDQFAVPGPAVVTSGSYTVFHAGNVINLLPGFSVQSGGFYNGVISDCIYGTVRSAKARWGDEIADEENSSVLESSVIAIPNPTTGVTTFSLKEEGKDAFVSYTLYSANGKEIARRTLNGVSSFTYDLKALPQGLYYFRIDGLERPYLATVSKL